MAYNLDFSAWNDARKAMAASIVNSASIAANAQLERNKIYANAVADVIEGISPLFNSKKKKTEEVPVQTALDMYGSETRPDLGGGMALDPMQAASAANAIGFDTDYLKYLK